MNTNSNEHFISNDARCVTLEDGIAHQINVFEISWLPISIGQFSTFAINTGYITTAERSGSIGTFRDHFGVSDVIGEARQSRAATMISYNDAIAYCEWAGVRLPTETEVIAASLVDTEIHDTVSDLMRARWKRQYDKGLIIGTGAKITSTITERGVAIRRGPFAFLTKNWEQKIHSNRLLRDKTHFDVTVEFHVCKRQ